MLIIKGERLKADSNNYKQIKISSEALTATLYGLYEENDCEDFEDFLDCLRDENILVYIEKKGVC